MKIDSALKNFAKKYDREAIEDIEKLSKDTSLTYQKSKIKLFNIDESFKKFFEFMDGYVEYKIDNKNNDNATSDDVIRKQISEFISKKIFTNSDVLYSNVNKFVQTFITEIKGLPGRVDKWKADMVKADVDHTSIGNINDYVDEFFEELSSQFDASMKILLVASGNVSKKRLAKKPDSKIKPSFL